MKAASPVLPLYASQLDADEILVGMVISSFFVFRTLLEIPAGYISDRAGYRIPLIAGFISSTLAAVILNSATTPFHLMVGRALSGLGSALFFNASMNLVVDMVESRVRGEAMGIFQGIEFIGGFLGAPIGGILAALFGFRALFTVTAVSMFIAVLATTLSRELADVILMIQIRGGRVKNVSWRDAFDGMRIPAFGFVCITGFLFFSTEIGLLSTIIPIFFNVSLVSILRRSAYS